MNNLKHALEAVLFVSGQPLSINKLTKITGRKADEIKSALKELDNEYQNRGIVLVSHKNTYQFGTSSKYSNLIKKLIDKELSTSLSRAALETLAIISYYGPISRPKIDYLRGVNSAITLRNLMMRGLIERVKNSANPQMPAYQVTIDFLRYLGLKGIDQLPDYNQLREKMQEKLKDLQEQ